MAMGFFASGERSKHQRGMPRTAQSSEERRRPSAGNRQAYFCFGAEATGFSLDGSEKLPRS
jgi:hypothetical protein